jgi:arylsulfatase A-like enzyme
MGWHTAMISPFAQRHAAHWFYAGFHEIHNTGHEGMESAEYVQPFVDRWMRENATRDNWFLHLNYWDPHTPYRMPQDYGNPFANDPLPAWLEEPGVLERHIAKTGPHSALDGAMYHDTTDPRYPRHPYRIDTPQQLRRAIDGYDTGIRYADEHIGKVVAALKAAGVYEETAIIISADHGENQGELGIYGEHPTADEITCRIPLIIKFPGGVAGRRDRGFHYHLDLAPTLMDLVGGRSFEIWDGESFAETVRTGAEAGRAEVVVSQCAMVCQRSVRWDQWLYMRTYHDGFHLFPQEMLFDIVADPHEQHDLASAWPEICREGAWRLMRWHDAQLQKMSRFASDSLDPLWTVLREGGPFHASLGQTPDPGGVPGLLRYLEHLEATGRSEGAARLREKYGRALLQ